MQLQDFVPRPRLRGSGRELLPPGPRKSRRETSAAAIVGARVARIQSGIAVRTADAAWIAMHALGTHRWRDGWETDPERGWSRYRGSRCAICDEPWEGW